MKTSENTPETLLTVMLKLSIFYLLCIAALNAPNVKGQTINVQSQKPPINATQQKVQQIYTSQIGIREKGSNSGLAVEQYLRYVNLLKGNPWCAAFVCWVYGQAGVSNPRSGWSPELFKASRTIYNRVENGELKVESGWEERRALFPPSLATGNRQQIERYPTPSTGDIFGLYFPEKHRIAHVGFIDQWDGTWMVAVEGNTNVSGSREGDGVYRKRRLVRSVYKVARYIK